MQPRRVLLAKPLRRHLLLAAPLFSLAGVLIAGCGSGTKVVSAHEGASTKTSVSTVTSSSSTSASAPEAASTATRTVTATSTRTSAAPAFAEQESSQRALTAAVATIQRAGYTPTDTSQYRPQQTLRVLTATRTGTGGEHQQRAFFFVDERYIGTDSSQPSASLKVLSQGETSVTLAYGMYRAGDSLCCPSGGQRTVRFQLNDGHLQALDAIPPAHSGNALARL